MACSGGSGAGLNSCRIRRAYATDVAVAFRRVLARAAAGRRSRSQLPHLRVGGAEGARALHLLEQVLGNRLAGLVVAREQVERLALPAPVLHDLRRQLDEVPGHVGAGQDCASRRGSAVVQQVAELVEDGLHFAVRQQRGLVRRPAA